MRKTDEKISDMDATDQSILAALRRDARASYSDLAQALGLSRTTVRGRIERMRADGQILGFTVVLKEDSRMASSSMPPQ